MYNFGNPLSGAPATQDVIDHEVDQIILGFALGNSADASKNLKALRKNEDAVSVAIVRGVDEHFRAIKAKENAEKEATAAKIAREQEAAVAKATRDAEARALHIRAMEDALYRTLSAIIDLIPQPTHGTKDAARTALLAYAAERLADKQ